MKKIKSLFNTPKKAIITSVCILLVIALGIASPFAVGAIVKSASIGIAKAESVALADAGLNKGDVTVNRVDFERDNGKFIYDVEFQDDINEYEYYIDAKTGEIIDKVYGKNGNAAVTKSPNSADNTASDTTLQIAGSSITPDEAKAIALKDAGLTANNVTFTKAYDDYDYDNGTHVYDIEFYSGSTEYEYEINVKTGEIVSKSSESFFNANTPKITENTAKPASPSEDGLYIGVDKAKTKALNDAGLKASGVTFTKQSLDNDDGTYVYAIEFFTATTEYEYEINAKTGAIIDKSTEAIYSPKPAATTSNSDKTSYIGVDKAKSIALNHAGFKASEVSFVKAKLENDDGKTEYEVVFYKGNTEYEYTIDAETGKITEHDSEPI